MPNTAAASVIPGGDPLILLVQQSLAAKGFNPGPLDGVKGRLTTDAVAGFQKKQKLPIQYPGSIGPITLKALGIAAPEAAAAALPIARPWLDLALRKKGLNEKRDYKQLVAFLKSDGATLGDPRKLPWCGDFIETCIAVTLPHEALPANPYLARNWQTFGVHCAPQLGAVGAFWRTSKTKSTDGHVAFIVGISADGTKFYILGGNQSDTISVVPIAASRLLDSRWPKTAELPARLVLPVMTGGTLSLNEV